MNRKKRKRLLDKKKKAKGKGKKIEELEARIEVIEEALNLDIK